MTKITWFRGARARHRGGGRGRWKLPPQIMSGARRCSWGITRERVRRGVRFCRGGSRAVRGCISGTLTGYHGHRRWEALPRETTPITYGYVTPGMPVNSPSPEPDQKTIVITISIMHDAQKDWDRLTKVREVMPMV